MNIQRQPRPSNYTQMCTHYQSTKTKKSKERIISYIMTLYMTNQLNQYIEHNNTIIPIDQLPRLINVKDSTLYRVMNEKLEEGVLAVDTGLQVSARAVQNGLFFGALEDRHRAESWYQEMVDWFGAVRNGDEKGYPANIAKEVNTSMSNLLASNQSILNVLTKLPGLFGTVPQNQNTINITTNQTQMVAESHQYLTPEMAVRLLTEKGDTDHKSPEVVYLEQGLGDIQDVVANSADAQGRNNLNPKDLVFTSHEDRRAHELGIVEE